MQVTMRTNTVTPDGKYDILTRNPIQIPHPRNPNRTYTHPKLAHVIYIDTAGNDTERHGVECATCGRIYPADSQENIAEAAKRAGGHTASHGHSKPRRRYPEQTIQSILQLVSQERHNRTDGVYLAVATELNNRGIPTANGSRWLAANVQDIYHRYADKDHPPTPTPAQPTPTDPSTELADKIDRLATILDNTAALVSRSIAQAKTALDEVAKLAQTTPPDPETIEKARRYDRIAKELTQ